jgi:hypothetical protein
MDQSMDKTQNQGDRKLEVDRTVNLTWTDFSEVELRATLAAMKSGEDPAASKRLIEYFYKRIHDSLPYDQTILFEYLDHVLGAIVNGQSANRAFGLERQSAKK